MKFEQLGQTSIEKNLRLKNKPRRDEYNIFVLLLDNGYTCKYVHTQKKYNISNINIKGLFFYVKYFKINYFSFKLFKLFSVIFFINYIFISFYV